MLLIAAANRACASGSTGLCLTLALAGSLPRKLSPFQFVAGLIGLGTKPPPQFGQTFSQNVVDTRRAKRALVGANARFKRLGWQYFIAVLARGLSSSVLLS
jgi:hypothetical protein